MCSRHNIAEILLRLVFNINQSIKSCLWFVIMYHETVPLSEISQHCPETKFTFFLVNLEYLWLSHDTVVSLFTDDEMVSGLHRHLA